MSNRQEWLEARRKGLGGSDIAAIMGISKWSTPMDIYLEKKGMAVDEDNNAKARGRILENAIALWYAQEMGYEVEEGPEMPYQGEKDFMMGSPDFWVWDFDKSTHDFWGLEVKTSRSDEGWGPSGSDQIPKYYATQVHWYMLVTGKDVWDVAVYFTFKDEFRHYRLVADKELHEKMLSAAEAWWNKHIVADVPPKLDGGKGSTQLLNHQFPEDTGEIREPSDRELELIEELNSINDALKLLQERKKTTENLIKDQMQDCSVIQGERAKVSWKLGKGRRTFDSKRFRADHPDLAEQYTKQGDPARTFRFTYKQEQ
jgi:putative phage-type endonuclease